MNHLEYINSGKLEDYCLGLLTKEERAEVEQMCLRYPEIKRELSLIQSALEKYALEMQRTPAPGLKNRIMGTIENLNRQEDLQLNNLPVIDKYSDHKRWLTFVKPMLPEQLETDEVSITLQKTDKIWQRVIKARADYPDEVHHDVYESLLILEGECVCKVGNKHYKFSAGDYLAVPMHVVHDLKITSPYITLIVQHIAA